MTRPDRFWNADHERVAGRVTGGLVAASLAAITTVEVFHSLYYDGNTRILSCSFSRDTYDPSQVFCFFFNRISAI